VAFRVNLGGEGEEAGAPNQQGRWVVLDPGWRSSRTGQAFAYLVGAGLSFLICDNRQLSLPDDCCDEVVTNPVPVDAITHLGPGVQTSEVQRILKPGGVWVHDNTLRWVKP